MALICHRTECLFQVFPPLLLDVRLLRIFFQHYALNLRVGDSTDLWFVQLMLHLGI